MKRSGMPRPTSCALSHVINLNKETESNEDTEPGHCTSILLCTVPQSTVTEQHECQSFGCVLKSSGFGIGAAVRSTVFDGVAVG